MTLLSLLLLFTTTVNLPDDPPAKPTPSEEFRAAYIELGNGLMNQRKKWLEEKDQQKKDQIMSDMIGTMAKKLLPLARKYPQTREAYGFLFECAAAGHEEGSKLLFELHDKSTDLGDRCISMCMQGVALGDRLCDTIMKHSKNKENRGRACLACAFWNMRQGDAAAQEDQLDKAGKQYAQAEARFKQAMQEFGDVEIDFGPKLGKKTIKTTAEQAYREVSKLTVGKPAPELAGIDLEGKPLALADYRGKVVMISFWAHWCGPCMAFVPHERSLLDRNAGKPFVLLGVNGDDPGKDLIEKTTKANITWKSLHNQPNEKATKHSEAWNVITWPTIYLIDANGIIRKKWVGRIDPKTLDETIEKLVKEAETKP